MQLHQQRVSNLKENQAKTTHILFAIQAGRASTSDFFSHENSIFPPVLTKNDHALMCH